MAKEWRPLAHYGAACDFGRFLYISEESEDRVGLDHIICDVVGASVEEATETARRLIKVPLYEDFVDSLREQIKEFVEVIQPLYGEGNSEDLDGEEGYDNQYNVWLEGLHEGVKSFLLDIV